MEMDVRLISYQLLFARSNNERASNKFRYNYYLSTREIHLWDLIIPTIMPGRRWPRHAHEMAQQTADDQEVRKLR
jgi:hypothetical protein